MNTLVANGACRTAQTSLACADGEVLVAALRESTVCWLDARIGIMLEQLDDALLEMAVNAASSAEQNGYFEAMNTLRGAGEDFRAGCVTRFRQHSTAAFAGGVPVHRDASLVGSAGELQMLDELLGRAVRVHHAPLAELNDLLNALPGVRRFDAAAESMLGPELLAECCMGAVRDLGFSSAATRAVFEQFERNVLGELEEFCARCTGMLGDAGVQAVADDPAAHRAAAASECALRERIVAKNRREQTRVLVALVFEAIAGDARLTVQTRGLLAGLRSVVEDAAIRDEGFFSTSTNPLRRFFSEVSMLALGRETIASGQPDAFVGTLARAIDGLGTSELSNAAILADFSAYAEDELQIARLTQRRTEDAEQSRVLQTSARVAIERVFAEQLGDCRLPAAAEELLRDGWRRVMTLAYLRGGAHGEQWQESLAVLGAFAQLWENGAITLPDFLAARLRDGMMHAGCDPLRTEILLESIEDDLRVWAPPAPLPVAIVQVSESSDNDALESDSPLGGGLREVDELARGTWVRFSAPAACGRLALRLGKPERLLFVDRQGIKLACHGREELAQMLAAGSALALSAQDLLDTALVAALDKLERGVAQASLKCSGANAW